MSKTAVAISSDIYEDNLHEENTIHDLSFRKLDQVPEIQNNLLQVLYLQNNCISKLPDDFFLMLPCLSWLDLRENCLTDIPANIQNHPSLTHLLLQNNKITSLPNELGTVNLKVLQLSGNPLTYPPKNIIDQGLIKILSFLNDNMVINANRSDASVSDSISVNGFPISEARSYNSVIDVDKLNALTKTLSIQFSEKEVDNSDDEYNGRLRNKCRKLPNSRKRSLPPYCQSSRYVRPVYTDGPNVANEKIKQSFLKELAEKKHKDMLAAREKVLQDRKTLEYLKQWRRNYKDNPFHPNTEVPRVFPYDTSPEYMTLLSREDIERDLPDKYKKKLVRRSKQTLPRKSNNDVHLAMKIKQLFDNLESVDLKRQGVSPRTEQKILLNEIEKISEIRQKLQELSTTNGRSVASD